MSDGNRRCQRRSSIGHSAVCGGPQSMRGGRVTNEKEAGYAAGDYPPEWIEQAQREGHSPDFWATQVTGAVHLAVWRRFHDATRFEQGLALTPLNGYDPIRFPSPSDGVARVSAVRQAREERADLPDGRWEWLLSFVWPNLGEEARKDRDAILAAVEALAPGQEMAAHRKLGAPRMSYEDREQQL